MCIKRSLQFACEMSSQAWVLNRWLPGDIRIQGENMMLGMQKDGKFSEEFGEKTEDDQTIV